MKQPGFHLLIAALTAILACTGDSPTSPKHSTNYTLEKSATIGPAGGSLIVDDFILKIPPAAFAQNQTIGLYASAKERPFDQGQVTRSFKLTGIPAEFSTPLQAAIKYQGVLAEESFIALGSHVFNPLVNDSLTTYSLYAAEDSAGFLLYHLSAAGTARAQHHTGRLGLFGAADEISGSLTMLGVTARKTHKSQHFTIIYPVHLVEVNIPSLANMLEELYAAVVGEIHLSYEECDWNWPAQVVILRFEEENNAWGAVDQHLKDGLRLMLNQNKLSLGDMDLVRLHAGQALLFTAMMCYDQESYEEDANLWLHLAVAAWAEEKFTANTAYRVPMHFPGNEMAPFNGMRAGASPRSTLLKHSFGMSAVIKYLAGDSRFGAFGLRDTYEEIWSGASATAALLRNVDALASEWWPQFFKSYITGGIYGAGKEVFTSTKNLSGSWSIAAAKDTLRQFTGQFPDLSARLYLLNLNHPGLDESADMVIKLSSKESLHEPLGVMAFKVTSDALVYLNHTIAQGSTTLHIEGLKDLYTGGLRQILVAAICSNVSNTYLDVTEAELEIRITAVDKPAAGAWKTGHLALNAIRGHYTRDYFDPGQQDSEYDYPDRNFDSIYFQGNTTGNTFTASWDHKDITGAQYQGTVLAVFSGNPPTAVSSIEWTEMVKTDQVTRSWSINLKDLDVTFSWEDGFTAKVIGAQTCGHVGSISHTISYSYMQDVLQEWKCSSDYPRSSVEVSFAK